MVVLGECNTLEDDCLVSDMTGQNEQYSQQIYVQRLFHQHNNYTQLVYVNLVTLTRIT